jgi:uncharacterized membrane protein affecting hemolysin expression
MEIILIALVGIVVGVLYGRYKRNKQPKEIVMVKSDKEKKFNKMS